MRGFYATLTMVSFILMLGEAETAMNQLLWSGSMMLICGFSAKGFEKYMTEEEKNERV